MKYVKRLTTFIVVLVVLMGAFSTVSFAGTVGQVLPSAESGWMRYDSNIANFVYTGSWSLVTNSEYYLGNTKTTTTPNDSVKFKFYGTKFRVMGAMSTTNASSVIVKVDGVQVGTFNCNQAALVRGCFMYEHAGMSVGTHLVELINNDSGSKNFTFDSLDIDDIGSLVDYCQPTNLQATAGDSQASLSWDTVTNATSYNVKRATTSGGIYTTIATTAAITYTDDNVTNGTTYYYVVSAVTANGQSANSNQVSATPNKENLTAKLSVLLNEGETVQLSTSYDLDNNKNFTWSSTNNAVATVDANGKVTAVAEGTTDIYAQNADGTFKEYIPVKVVKGIADELRLAVHLKAGEKAKLYLTDDASKVTWSSMDNTIATISTDGQITGVKKGLAIVQATLDGKTYQIYVRVNG
ncbi:MAG: Ig-like domain-containing protein [Aminipila sp.]